VLDCARAMGAWNCSKIYLGRDLGVTPVRGGGGLTSTEKREGEERLRGRTAANMSTIENGYVMRSVPNIEDSLERPSQRKLKLGRCICCPVGQMNLYQR
jgi:hypothetical protein